MTNVKVKMQNSKVAVVTGGVRRLGRQISYFLADEGYDLALIYNSSSPAELNQTKKALESKNIRFKFYKCDLTDSKKIKLTIDSIGRDFKKIDLLVNNAGVIKKVEFEDITSELIDKTFAVNLKAPLFVTQHAVKYLNKSKKPLVINLASLGGMQNWTAYMPYSLSKTAQIKLTYLLARKLAPKIRVNAIAPGTIIVEGEEEGTPQKTDVKRIPLQKYGNPHDIIEAVRFIISCEYVTGLVIPVEGGRLLNN